MIGAPTKVIKVDQSFRTYVYDQFGQPTSIKNELGHETKIDYSPVGLPELMVDALGAETSFCYDPSGRPKTITDPNGNTTLYTYDPQGQLIRETNQLGDSRRFAYRETVGLGSRSRPAATKQQVCRRLGTGKCQSPMTRAV